MSLTVEERRGIYEEEKDRVEEQVKAEIAAAKITADDKRRRIYEEDKAVEAQEWIKAEIAATRTRADAATTENAATVRFYSHVIHSPSWAAFCLSFLYLFSMRLTRPGILMLSLFLLGFLPGIHVLIGLVSVGFAIYYAFNAKRMAWDSRPWANFDDYLRCQRIWDGWAKAWLAFVVLAALAGAILSSFWPMTIG